MMENDIREGYVFILDDDSVGKLKVLCFNPIPDSDYLEADIKDWDEGIDVGRIGFFWLNTVEDLEEFIDRRFVGCDQGNVDYSKLIPIKVEKDFTNNKIYII